MKNIGSISNELKSKSLKHCWICQPVSKKASASGGGDKVGQSIEQGYLITLKLSRRSEASGMTDIRKYRVINMYKKSYNKWFINGEKKYWSVDME